MSNRASKKIEIKYGLQVEELIRILHMEWPSEGKVSASVKVPEFFHQPPDPFLSKEELKFKAMMYFESVGSLKPSLIQKDTSTAFSVTGTQEQEPS